LAGTEAHACDRDGDFQRDRLARKPCPDRYVGAAFLAIAFQWITADRGTQKKQIVEMRQPALRPEATDVVNTGRRGAAYFRE
jgi:hypothetical protein